MKAPALELGDIFRLHGPAYLTTFGDSLSHEQKQALRAIGVCRTPALGGHVDQCDRCGYRKISYCSCRNRHCPKCHERARAQWLEQRAAELLPVEYFHVVFTLPQRLAPLALQNQRLIYGILFRAAAETLTRIAGDPRHLGARIGFLAVLHTWGQNLNHHPHLHCVVPGGGIALDQRRWISCRQQFLFPVKVLSRLFRAKFVAYLKTAFRDGKLGFHGQLKSLSERRNFVEWLSPVAGTEWVVYAKPPFGGPRLQPARHHDPAGGGVRSALSAARFAPRLHQSPPLRIAGQPRPAAESRLMPQTVGGELAGAGLSSRSRPACGSNGDRPARSLSALSSRAHAALGNSVASTLCDRLAPRRHQQRQRNRHVVARMPWPTIPFRSAAEGTSMPRFVSGARSGSPACFPHRDPPTNFGPSRGVCHCSLSQLSTRSHCEDRGPTACDETAPI
jgi:hypothetical protein